MAQAGQAQTLSGQALARARRRALSQGGKGALASAQVRPQAQPRARSATTPAPAVRPAATARPQPARSGGGGARAASLARRRALSTSGKRAMVSQDRIRDGARHKPAAPTPAGSKESTGRGDCGCGCKENREKTSPAPEAPAAKSSSRSNSRPTTRRREIAGNTSRAVSLARRRAQSARGKAGMGASGMTAAQTARAANPELSGRGLAKALRANQSQRGRGGRKKSEPCGRRRPARENSTGAAQDASWKVGASETSHGQTVTGTLVGRSHAVTGDEPSTCRAVTGTEYLGADIFREFCQAEPAKAVRRVGVSPTSRGNQVTGNEVGRSTSVTGDEPGTCKRVTGTEYIGTDQVEAFCGVRPEPNPAKVTGVETRHGKTVTGSNVGRSERVTGDESGAERDPTGTQYTSPGPGGAPAKVGASATLRGGSVTGTLVGRRERMTGDEPGSCRNVTGDDYVGQEQYREFCATTPTPDDHKVGISRTLQGEAVTGTQTGRSGRVTGDEPGTCKAVTGTPYAGSEQYRSFCDADSATLAEARVQRPRRFAGAPMTGQQPSVAGKMTGDSKGACEPVSGTPYVGADQVAVACPATAAEPGSPDFPQALTNPPWGQFSVEPPAHATGPSGVQAGVTGSQYEQGHITGPFGMAAGKVTGTEQARFGRGAAAAMAATPPTAESLEGRVKSRVTGEGIDAGLKITGDDWDRGDRVTGTEGPSAQGRNPSQRGGPMSAMAPLRVGARNTDLAEPVSKVTGGSGNTDKGSLITYSGGARG